ncbi:hypothetical protein MRX96_043458 [Rhipicephalus microplus]
MVRLPPRVARRQALPVGDAAFLTNDNDHNVLSDDVAVSSPPLDAGSSPVVLPGSPVFLASSSSLPATVDAAAAVPDKPDEVPEQPESDNATLQMPPDHIHLLEDRALLLRSLLRDPPSDESWAQCEAAWTRAVALAVAAVRLHRCVLVASAASPTLPTLSTLSGCTAATVAAQSD